MPGVFVIARDARGSLVHVRRRDDGGCIGCIEAGLFEIVRTILLEECGDHGRRSEGANRVPAAAGAATVQHEAVGGNDDGG